MINSRTLKNMKKALFLAMAVATLAILPATAQAVPIVGTLDLTGAVRVTPTDNRLAPAGTGTGFAQVQPTSTGYFAPLGGFIAQELDLVGLPVGVQLITPPATRDSGFRNVPWTRRFLV